MNEEQLIQRLNNEDEVFIPTGWIRVTAPIIGWTRIRKGKKCYKNKRRVFTVFSSPSWFGAVSDEENPRSPSINKEESNKLKFIHRVKPFVE